MMKHLSAITLIILLLLISCRQERAVSPRLVELDSLIAVAPDSAAALLEAIPAASLHDPEDRAYHALLITQAKYKAYIPATSDSAINLAVDYYVTDNKGGYDHRIRSLIYKGCIMTELNQPDSAMYWFKSAETAARPDDHANLGYINYKIGELFTDELGMDSTTINYLNTALRHFTYTNDTIFQLSSLIRLGLIECLNKKSDSKLKEAQQLAIEFGENDYVFHTLEHLSLQALQGNQYQQAKELSMNAILQGDSSVACYSYVVMSYSGLGYADSALFYLRMMPKPKNMADSMTYHRAHAEKARLLNNMDDYVYHDDLAGQIADTIFLEAQQAEIKEIEQKYENQILTEQVKISRTKFWLVTAILALVLVSTLFLAYRLRNEARERSLTKTRLQQTVGQLYDLRTVLAQNEKDLNLLKSENEQALASKALLQSKLQTSGNRLKCLDEIIRGFHNLLQQERAKSKTRKISMNSDFWVNLEECVNDGYGNLMDASKGLGDKEQKLLHLCCLNVPIEVSAMLLDVSIKTLQNYRSNIAKQISAQQTSNLDDAIEQFKTSDIG